MLFACYQWPIHFQGSFSCFLYFSLNPKILSHPFSFSISCTFKFSALNLICLSKPGCIGQNCFIIMFIQKCWEQIDMPINNHAFPLDKANSIKIHLLKMADSLPKATFSEQNSQSITLLHWRQIEVQIPLATSTMYQENKVSSFKHYLCWFSFWLVRETFQGVCEQAWSNGQCSHKFLSHAVIA